MAMDPETRLFLAELRAARPSALNRLRRTLRANGGNVILTARALGIGVQTLYEQRRVPEVAEVLAAHSQGREGSRRAAAAAKRLAAAERAGSGPAR